MPAGMFKGTKPKEAAITTIARVIAENKTNVTRETFITVLALTPDIASIASASATKCINYMKELHDYALFEGLHMDLDKKKEIMSFDKPTAASYKAWREKLENNGVNMITPEDEGWNAAVEALGLTDLKKQEVEEEDDNAADTNAAAASGGHNGPSRGVKEKHLYANLICPHVESKAYELIKTYIDDTAKLATARKAFGLDTENPDPDAREHYNKMELAHKLQWPNIDQFLQQVQQIQQHGGASKKRPHSEM